MLHDRSLSHYACLMGGRATSEYSRRYPRRTLVKTMRYVADMRRCQYVVQRPEGVRRRQRLNCRIRRCPLDREHRPFGALKRHILVIVQNTILYFFIGIHPGVIGFEPSRPATSGSGVMNGTFGPCITSAVMVALLRLSH